MADEQSSVNRPATEGAAVVAVLRAEGAGLAVRVLVDGVVPIGSGGKLGGGRGLSGVGVSRCTGKRIVTVGYQVP